MLAVTTTKERIFITRSARSFALIALLLASLAAAAWVVVIRFKPPDSDAYVRASGRQLVQHAAPVILRAVNFSNFYWMDLGQFGFDLKTSRHHSEIDFERVRDLGFNSIRFAFNGNWYRENPRAFWRWLDQNVKWAEQHEVMLTLDLHVPIGGFWLDPNSDKLDFSLWTDEALRLQNIEMWRAIAARYKNSTAIAAYELLNEAVTDDATGAQWESLAQDMVQAIRQVDGNHLLVVGALYGTDRHYRTKDRDSLFLVDDSNVMYDFHFYHPIEYTHQSASWIETPMGDGGTYPDNETPIPTGKQVLLADSSIRSQRLRPADTVWLPYESDWVELTDPTAIAGLPTMVMRSGAGGTVNFDDVQVIEYDAASAQLKQTVSAPITQDSVWQWWGWGNADLASTSTALARAEIGGANDRYSLKIDARTTPEQYLGWSSDKFWFRVTPGNLYKITGKMKGSGVSYPESESDEVAFAGLELNFYSDPTSGDDPAFLFRNKAYLEAKFLEMYQFGVANNVPMSVLEFGTILETFETDGKGGEKWIADILDIVQAHDTSFALWVYRGPAMGLYLCEYGTGPQNPNLKLMRVLKEKLGDWGN